MKKVVAIIPARGGSKGIPRKNVLPLCGRPLIGWTIEAAQEAQSITRVVVSTDDPEIAEVSRRFGADVVERPGEISRDLSSSEAALLHVLGELREREGYQPEIVAFLQCTAPLTAAVDVDGTVEALEREQAQSAVAVVDFHYFLWRRDKDGNASGINHEKSVRKMRQEREPQYLEAGAVYAMRTRGFIESGHRFFGKTALYVMPAERRLEIDEPLDFQLAEMLLRSRERKHKAERMPRVPSAVVFDFDGVFTDNRVLVSEAGEEAAWCNRSDGWGISELKSLGIPVLVLSTEQNPIVAARCRKLGIACEHNHADKASVLQDWLSVQGIAATDVVYVGNDVNDIGCLRLAGCGMVVADAHPKAVREASIVLESRGGHGAVRELTDLICDRIKGE